MIATKMYLLNPSVIVGSTSPFRLLVKKEVTCTLGYNDFDFFLEN